MLIMAGLLTVLTVLVMLLIPFMFIVFAMFLMPLVFLVFTMLFMPLFGRYKNDPFAFEHRKCGALYGDILFKRWQIYLHLGKCVQKKRLFFTLYPEEHLGSLGLFIHFREQVEIAASESFTVYMQLPLDFFRHIECLGNADVCDGVVSARLYQRHYRCLGREICMKRNQKAAHKTVGMGPYNQGVGRFFKR